MIPVLTPQSLNINRHFQQPISILEAITSLLGVHNILLQIYTLLIL